MNNDYILSKQTIKNQAQNNQTDSIDSIKTYHINDVQRGMLQQILEKNVNLKVGKGIVTYEMGVTNKGWGVVKTKFNFNISKIATQLGCSRTTIRKETLRGLQKLYYQNQADKPSAYVYRANVSCINHCCTHKARYTNRPLSKISNNNKIIESITKLVNDAKLSLLAVYLHFRKSNWFDSNIKFCFKSLYTWAKKGVFGSTKVLKYLYKTKDKVFKPTKRQLGTSIQQRPEYINDRSEPFHWEGDTIVGRKGSNSCVLVLSERKSRKYIGRKIMDAKAKTVTDAIKQLQNDNIIKYGETIKSITLDNGMEFSDWETFCKDIQKDCYDINAYFCNSYCAWQKGGVENLNKMFRQFYKKGTNFDDVSQIAIDDAIETINKMPRMSLDGLSANEFYQKLCIENVVGNVADTTNNIKESEYIIDDVDATMEQKTELDGKTWTNSSLTIIKNKSKMYNLYALKR